MMGLWDGKVNCSRQPQKWSPVIFKEERKEKAMREKKEKRKRE